MKNLFGVLFFASCFITIFNAYLGIAALLISGIILLVVFIKKEDTANQGNEIKNLLLKELPTPPANKEIVSCLSFSFGEYLPDDY